MVLVEMGARSMMRWKGSWFVDVVCFGSELRRKCCSDDLVRGRACCMMPMSSVFDWRTARRNEPDRTMRCTVAADGVRFEWQIVRGRTVNFIVIAAAGIHEN